MFNAFLGYEKIIFIYFIFEHSNSSNMRKS